MARKSTRKRSNRNTRRRTNSTTQRRNSTRRSTRSSPRTVKIVIESAGTSSSNPYTVNTAKAKVL